MSWKTIKRALKRLGASYRRARRVPARARNEKREARFEKALEKARILAEQGAIDILHGDESGFCLLPAVPYLWQLKAHTVGLLAQSHNQRLNVLGFWREAGVEAARLFHRLVLGRLKSTHVIRAVEEQLLPFLVRPTVLLLDNAALHRSKRIKQKLRAWKSAGLHVWFLPPYCPHLNLMEIVWKQIKHHRLQPDDYTDFPTLCAGVSRCLHHFNSKIPHYIWATT